MNPLRRPLLLAVLIVIALAAFLRSPAQTTAGDSPSTDAWPLASVEIPDSAGLTSGRLENGLRYLIRPHAAPDRQLSLRLFVNAGSLHENDDERGFAHFVEHMAFNGTKNFPAGEIVKLLQRQGARHGPHVNAFTDQLSTWYKLDLPASAPDSLETGLRIFRDFADGIRFESREVKRERGVILSEARTRQTPQQEQQLAYIDFLYRTTRIPSRPPIGLAAQIENADRAALRRFYDAWYRPENLTVLVTGDVAPAGVEALIRKHFTSLTARGQPRPAPDIGKVPSLAAPAVAIYPRPTAGAQISCIQIMDRPAVRTTWGDQLKGLQINTAIEILRTRLARLAETPGHVIHQALSAQEIDFRHFRRLSLSVAAAPANVAPAVALLEQEIRRACESGFTPAEIARQQDILRRHFQSIAATFPAAPTALVADSDVEHWRDGSPLQFPSESLATILEMTGLLTPENCRNAFREFFGERPPRIFISCTAAHLPSEEAIATAYRESRAAPLTGDMASATDAAFDYTDFGPPGSVAEKIALTDLGVWQLRLDNNVRINLKPTAYEPGRVHFSLRLGYGRLSEPAGQPALALWFPFLWKGGTGRHSSAELDRMIGGLDGITTSTFDDACALSGSVVRGDLPVALRQLTALLVDPAFREEGWEQTRSAIKGYTGPLWNSPDGPVVQFVYPLLAGRDPRIGIPADKKIDARTPEEFRAWIAPQLASGPVEFSLVGDFDVEATIGELTRTLGALSAREPRGAKAFSTTLNFLRDRRATRYYFSGTAERPSRWEFFWRIRDPHTARERLAVQMLAAIFGDRVRDEVRERKGSAYRVESYVAWNDVYPGFSFLRCSVDHQPADREKHTRAVRKLALAIAAKGVTADELARAKAQTLASIRRNQTDNTHWLREVLADSQQRPFRLDAFRTAESDIEAITVADVNALAARYFGPDRVFHYAIMPSALMPKKK